MRCLVYCTKEILLVICIYEYLQLASDYFWLSVNYFLHCIHIPFISKLSQLDALILYCLFLYFVGTETCFLSDHSNTNFCFSIANPFLKGNFHLYFLFLFARECFFIHVDNWKALDLIKRISTSTFTEPFHYAALHRLHFETWW